MAQGARREGGRRRGVATWPVCDPLAKSLNPIKGLIWTRRSSSTEIPAGYRMCAGTTMDRRKARNDSRHDFSDHTSDWPPA